MLSKKREYHSVEIFLADCLGVSVCRNNNIDNPINDKYLPPQRHRGIRYIIIYVVAIQKFTQIVLCIRR